MGDINSPKQAKSSEQKSRKTDSQGADRFQQSTTNQDNLALIQVITNPSLVNLTPARVMQLQRLYGNHFVSGLVQRATTNQHSQATPEKSTAALTEDKIQRAVAFAKVKEATIGKGTHRVYNFAGKHVGVLVGGSEIRVDDKITGPKVEGKDTVAIVYIEYSDKNKENFSPPEGWDGPPQYFIKKDHLSVINVAPSVFDEDYKPETGKPDANESGGGEEEEGGAKMETKIGPGEFELSKDKAQAKVPLFEGGPEIVVTIDKDGNKTGEVTGKVEGKKAEAPFPEIKYSLDIPTPVPGVSVTLGVEIAPKLEFGFEEATYSFKKDKTGTTFTADNLKVGGYMGLEITEKGGVALGIANIATLDAGLYAKQEAKSELNGEAQLVIGGPNRGFLIKQLLASASIGAEVGAYVEAKAFAGMLSKGKQYPLSQKTFASFEYKRENVHYRNFRQLMRPRFNDIKMIKKDGKYYWAQPGDLQYDLEMEKKGLMSDIQGIHDDD